MKNRVLYLFLLLIGIQTAVISQNEAKKWYFGNQAGLDFMTSPPTILTNGVMNCSEGSASIANAAGNLLFYTDGVTIYNQSHLAMTSGSFMAGGGNACQSSLIVKQPGNTNIYYVFLVAGNAGGLYYSIVDMNQSAGLGAVTVSNVIVSSAVTEKLTATKHCNGTDVWIVAHNWGNNQFMAYLLTSTGLSAGIFSNVGTMHNGLTNNVLGCMKISPTGKKLGLAIWATINTFEVYDFDNVTGVVSNPVILGNTFQTAYGCEFSPDGSKFYGCCEVGVGTSIYQWDLCAGSTSAAIVASQYSVIAAGSIVRNGMQVATDGKIYVARNTQSSLGVINSPNLAGAACNYVDAGQSLGTQLSTRGLPNFVSTFFKQAPPPITYSVNMAVSCVSATLSSASTTISQIGCASSGFSVTGFLWKFGDPASGPSNTSTATNPVHVYTGPGTYTAQLIINYSCGGGTDTVVKLIALPTPTLSVVSSTAACNVLATATVTTLGGSGNYSYTWTPTAITSSVAANINPGTYTLNMYDNISGCVSTATANVTTPVNSSPLLIVSSDTICPLATAVLSVSGASSHTWLPSGFVGNVYTVSPSSTTIYSVVGVANTCTSLVTASVVLKSIPVVTVSSNSPVCAGQTLHLNAGGGASYFWIGPSGFTTNVSGPSLPGLNVINAGNYSVLVTGANNCTASISTSVVVNPIPTLNISASTVCVGYSLTFSVNAPTGSTFNWSGPGSFSSISQNPSIPNAGTVMTGVYNLTVTSLLNCTNTSSIVASVLTLPNPAITCNSPICEGTSLVFQGAGGALYSWAGPNSFTSSVQNPSINITTPLLSGTYTLTASNNYCAVDRTIAVAVYPAPSLTLQSNSPVCETKSLSLKAITQGSGLSYFWKGPLGYSDILQDSGRDSCKISYSGLYTITVTDLNACKTSMTASVTILGLPQLTVSGATVCLHESASLKALGAATYTWTGPAFYLSYNPNPIISNASHTVPYQYTLVAGASNNCTVQAFANVVTLPLPLASLSVSATKACANASIHLQGFGGKSYLWQGPGSFSFDQPDITFTTSSSGNSGTYSLTVKDSLGCKSITTTVLEIYPALTGSLAGKSKYCIPFCSEYKFYTAATSSIISSTWQFDGLSFTGENFKTCFTNAGNYSLVGKFMDSNNCSTTASFVINAWPKPKADFEYSPTSVIENTEDVFFTNTSTGDKLSTMTWYFSNNENTQTGKRSSYFYKDAGLFPVVLLVKNEWGCADTMIRTIHVETDFRMYVPNTFTPNNDELNDLFLPVGRGIKSYYLAIFDRWGTQLFESTELQKGWDGTYKGSPCKTDVYSWKMIVSSTNGEIKQLKGHVNVMR